MAELLLLANADTAEPDPNQRRIGFYFPDIMTKETITRRNVITDEPIESGEFVQDHVFTEPLMLEIDGMHGESATQVVADGGTVETGRTRLAYDVMTELCATKTPFDVVLGLDTFPNMLIEELEIVQSSEVGDAIVFNARLKQITTVESRVTQGRLVTPARVAPAVAPKAAEPKAIGEVPLKPLQPRNLFSDVI